MKLVRAAVLCAVTLGAEPASVKVPMRDGVLLAADVYGADAARPKPVLLSRTPYNKTGLAGVAERYASHGYVVVIQDCRGRYASEGFYTPYNDDRQDGYDTTEWINRQPWSNGRIGMFGGSHTGLVQWLAMAEEAPGLAAIAPAFTASSLYRVAYRDGALRLALIGSGGTRAHPPPAPRKLPSEIGLLHYHLPLMHLPLARLEEAYGWSLPWMSSLLAHPAFNDFWRQTSAEQDIPSSDLPVQIITGYYDFFHHEAVQDFQRVLSRKSKAPVQLIIGPWTHGSTGRRRTQDMDFGASAALDAQEANLEWFNRHLRGETSHQPLVRYFVLGENRWREAGDWPPTGATPTPLYLRAGQSAAFTSPGPHDGGASFASDPANPVPSVPYDRREINRAALWSPLDYTAIATRKDVLTWTTEPLSKPLLFAGPLTAELWVEADTPDADWIVRLFALPPKGLALPLAHGIVRGSFRESLSQPSPLVPGQRYKLTVDLGSCAALLAAGHRLRVEVAGSSFPMYDRNTHTAEGPFAKRAIPSNQRIFHQQDQASAIVLPVLPPISSR